MHRTAKYAQWEFACTQLALYQHRMSDDEIVKVQPEELRKGGYCMIRGQPCRITELEHVSKATANGNKKLHIVGLQVFTAKKYEDTINLTAGFHGIDAPVSAKAQYSLLDVDLSTGFLSLLTDGGETKEDAALGRADDGKAFDDIGADIVRRFEADEPLTVTVLTIMGKDIVVDVSKDTSAS